MSFSQTLHYESPLQQHLEKKKQSYFHIYLHHIYILKMFYSCVSSYIIHSLKYVRIFYQ